MKYQTVIFDLDGTLADTSPGILNCHRYAHRMMGHKEPPETVLHNVIGAPLLQTYQSTFGFSEAEARQALVWYRKRYEERGVYESRLYPGIKQVLSELKFSGCNVGLASLKAERFVKIILKLTGIEKYFDAVYGMDDLDSRTKTQLIRFCMNDFHAVSKDTVLIGDSSYDQIGAQNVGIEFIGVTYGFGFTEGDEMAGDCAQLLKLLL